VRLKAISGWMVLVLLICAAGPAVSGVLEIDDAIAQAEFAYYAREEGTLRAAIAALERAGNEQTAGRAAALGYAYWKLALLAAPGDPQRATEAAERCTDLLAQAPESSAGDAVAQALDAACNNVLAGLRNIVSGALNGHRANRSLAKALELAPGDPRVLLVDALNAYSRPSAFGGERPPTRRRFQEAADAYDAITQQAAPSPWGHAEALAWLGRTALEEGDTLAAREALERALILAPQYIDARDWLAQVTAAH